MGEPSASTVHNAFNHVLPQPTPSIVAEDDDEPPSSGPDSHRTPEMKQKPSTSASMSTEFDTTVHEKDFAVNTFNDNIAADKVHRRAPRSDPEKGADTEATLAAAKAAGARPAKVLNRASRIRAMFHIKENVGPAPTYLASLHAAFRYSPLNLLLLCIPVSWALHYTHQTPTLIFTFSALGIIPLAALLGLGTEQIALKTSQSVGGLLNASLGNLIELIISGIALHKCELGVVQSTLLGGLLSNLLLVLGMSFIVGGFKFSQQQFQPMVAQLNSSLLIVAVISLTIPTAFHQYLEARLVPGTEVKILLDLSRGSAVILILIYVAYLFFQFYSHNHLFLDTVQESIASTKSTRSTIRNSSSQSLPLPVTSDSSSSYTSSTSSSSSSEGEEVPKLNTPTALILLVIVTALAYVTAEYLVESLEGVVADHPNVSKEWITLIVIPIISNAAEHATAVVVASKGKFDLAMGVAVGSCIQISLFVIPFLVLIAWAMGKPLTLMFDPLETVVLFLSVLLVKFSVEDGKSHWMNGLALMSVYTLIAVSFWYYPNGSVTLIQGQPLLCS